jgi:hypothetical protein
MQTDLASFPDNPESNLRFLAMLAGPYYPILHVANARFVCFLYPLYDPMICHWWEVLFCLDLLC